MLIEVIKRIRYWNNSDRIGPDMLSTHWMLYFRSTMLKLCMKKFKRFADSADFRPGAYAVGCSKISLGGKVIVRPLTMLLADTNEDGGGIIIEDFVMMGSDVHIFADKHVFSDPKKPVLSQGFSPSRGVVLKKGCWVGARSIICPDVTIGENSVIGAGSVVTEDIPDRVVAVGNPARVVKKIT